MPKGLHTSYCNHNGRLLQLHELAQSTSFQQRLRGVMPLGWLQGLETIREGFGLVGISPRLHKVTLH